MFGSSAGIDTRIPCHRDRDTFGQFFDVVEIFSDAFLESFDGVLMGRKKAGLE
jgi:hypothetical protein